MKIVTNAEISLNFSDLEKMIREKNLIPEELELTNIVNIPGKKGMRFMFSKTTGDAEDAKTTIMGMVKETFLNCPLDELSLSVRTKNCMKAEKITNMSELITYSKEELGKFRNFGQKSINEIEELLTKYDLHFRT